MLRQWLCGTVAFAKIVGVRYKASIIDNNFLSLPISHLLGGTAMSSLAAYIAPSHSPVRFAIILHPWLSHTLSSRLLPSGVSISCIQLFRDTNKYCLGHIRALCVLAAKIVAEKPVTVTVLYSNYYTTPQKVVDEVNRTLADVGHKPKGEIR